MPDPTGWSAPFLTTAPAGEEILPDPTPNRASITARYHLTASQAIPFNTEAVVLWNARVTDDDAFGAASSGAISLPDAGIYLLHVHIYWEQRSAKLYTVHIETAPSVGGFSLRSDAHVLGPFRTAIASSHFHEPDPDVIDGTRRISVSVTDWGRFSANDRVRVTVLHDRNPSGDISVIGGGAQYSYFNILRIGT